MLERLQFNSHLFEKKKKKRKRFSFRSFHWTRNLAHRSYIQRHLRHVNEIVSDIVVAICMNKFDLLCCVLYYHCGKIFMPNRTTTNNLSFATISIIYHLIWQNKWSLHCSLSLCLSFSFYLFQLVTHTYTSFDNKTLCRICRQLKCVFVFGTQS